MSEEDNMFEGIGETLELEIENTDALKELFNETKKESLKIQERFENGTYTEDDLLNHLPRFGLGTKDKIEMYVVESKYFEDLVSRYTNLKEIEKSHQEENGKLRVELEKEKEKNTELRIQISAREQVCEDLQKQLNGAFDRGFISKDKIKEKIVEIINSSARYNVLCKINENEETRRTRYAVAVLKELLEEK